jgi:hypothetical protein
MALPSIVQALANCLERLRLGSDADVALEGHPEYRAELKALLEVASLIRPLAENVEPSPAMRESIWARLLELQDEPTLPLFHAGGAPSEAC